MFISDTMISAFEMLHARLAAMEISIPLLGVDVGKIIFTQYAKGGEYRTTELTEKEKTPDGTVVQYRLQWMPEGPGKYGMITVVQEKQYRLKIFRDRTLIWDINIYEDFTIRVSHCRIIAAPTSHKAPPHFAAFAFLLREHEETKPQDKSGDAWRTLAKAYLKIEMYADTLHVYLVLDGGQTCVDWWWRKFNQEEQSLTGNVSESESEDDSTTSKKASKKVSKKAPHNFSASLDDGPAQVLDRQIGYEWVYTRQTEDEDEKSDANVDTLTITFPTSEQLTLKVKCVMSPEEIEKALETGNRRARRLQTMDVDFPSDSGWVKDSHNSEYFYGTVAELEEDTGFETSFENATDLRIHVFQNWIRIRTSEFSDSHIYLRRANLIYPMLIKVKNSRLYDLVGWGGAIAAGESGARGDGGGDGGGKDSGGGDSRGDGTGGYEDGGDSRGDGTGGLPFKHYGGHDAGPSGGSGDPPVVSVVPPRVPWDEAPGAPAGGDGGHFGATSSGSAKEAAPAGSGDAGMDDTESDSNGDDDVIEIVDDGSGVRHSERARTRPMHFVTDVAAHQSDRARYAAARGGASSGGASKRPRPAMAPGGGASQRPRPAPQVVPAVVVPPRPQSASTRPVRNPNPNFRFDFGTDGRSDTDRRKDLKTQKGS